MRNGAPLPIVSERAFPNSRELMDQAENDVLAHMGFSKEHRWPAPWDFAWPIHGNWPMRGADDDLQLSKLGAVGDMRQGERTQQKLRHDRACYREQQKRP